MIVGIDLGTTNSVVAYMGPDGPKLIPNALGEFLTPSVVGVDAENQILVGAAAREYSVTHPDRCAALFKRHMGSDWKADLPIKKFRPEELSSFVLRNLKEDAEAHLGELITQAVITVPAYFNDNQRKATIRAGQMAGLKVERIINEPTAAAIAYGFHEAEEDKTIVVFDLGGGTFDVSIVEMFEGAVEVRASSGECFLGGEDFTRMLAARVLETHGYVFEHLELKSPKLISRMIQQCERAKTLLSKQNEVEVSIANEAGEVTEESLKVKITREQFQQWTEHIMARIELPIRRGLGDANLKRSDVDEIILVGGATRMPIVVDRVTEIFQKPPRTRLNPDEVVAVGAAVQAGLIGKQASVDDLVVTDVSPFTLGVEVSKRVGMEVRDGYFMPIINRNTTIPVSRVKRVSTLQANQTDIRIHVYQGESRKVKDNLSLGEFTVRGIPRGPSGQEVDVRLTYDLNGVLEVEATVVETKKKVGMVISKHAEGLSDEQIARAVDEMQMLKSHPREETENRFLLKRAERVYRELPLIEREILSDLMDGFETVLDLQDKEAVEKHRESLAEFLDRYEEGFNDESSEDEYDSWN